MQLNPQDIAQFRANAYLVVRGLFKGRDLADFSRSTDNVEALPETPGDAMPRRPLCISHNRASEGDWRVQYYVDKRRSFPPDCEREPGKVYEYKV